MIETFIDPRTALFIAGIGMLALTGAFVVAIHTVLNPDG